MLSGSVREYLCRQHIVGDRCQRLLLQQRHMFEGSGMKDQVWHVLGADFIQQRRIVQVAEYVDQLCSKGPVRELLM